MEKTVRFEMTQSQAEKFEKLLDSTLEVLTKMEKESPERESRFKENHEDFLKKIAETEKMMQKTSQKLAKWKASLES